MNRLLFCIILLLSGHSVLAEKLYRWVEPDGSITFSPNPPPAGVEFKAIDAAHNNAAKADLPKSNLKPSILATSEHGLDLPQTTGNAADADSAEQAAVPEVHQKLTYAPDTGSKIKTSPLPNADASNINQAEPSKDNTLLQTDTTADSKKRRHCQDLYKRVMSLERRLRSPLEPVDMDNTVMAMARYQRSFDRHCVE